MYMAKDKEFGVANFLYFDLSKNLSISRKFKAFFIQNESSF